MVETVLGMTDLQIKLFTALGQILVAAAVGAIAWRQWRTAQQQAETAHKKLIADLFDRRFQLYSRFRDLVHTVMVSNGKELDHSLIEISMLKHELRWVFGKELVNELDTKVISKFTPMALAKANMQSTEGTQYSMHAEEYRQARKRADLGTTLIPEIFEESLTLRH